MSASRQRILTHLKKVRTASAREIARALKMSAPNVRHHLSVLSSDGRVEETSIREPDGRGRPEKVFSLSQTAMGDNLPVLVGTLLGEQPDPQQIGERLATSLGGHEAFQTGPMAKRLAELVRHLNEMHYEARWEAGAEGPRLLFGHCPYARVIAEHPELCKIDLFFINSALGQSVSQKERPKEVEPGLCPFVFIIG